MSAGSHSRRTTRASASRVAGGDVDDLRRRKAEHADRRFHQSDEPIERPSRRARDRASDRGAARGRETRRARPCPRARSWLTNCCSALPDGHDRAGRETRTDRRRSRRDGCLPARGPGVRIGTVRRHYHVLAAVGDTGRARPRRHAAGRPSMDTWKSSRSRFGTGCPSFATTWTSTRSKSTSRGRPVADGLWRLRQERRRGHARQERASHRFIADGTCPFDSLRSLRQALRLAPLAQAGPSTCARPAFRI